MDKGLKRRVAPASRAGGGSSIVSQNPGGDGDEGEAAADGGGQGGGGSELLPLYHTGTNAVDGSDKKYKHSTSLRRRKKATSSSAGNAWCTWGGFLTLMLMALVGWILSLMLFSGSSPSQRLAHQALHAVTGLRYYTPKLYTSAGARAGDMDDNISKEKYQKEDFPWPMIHIVNTRFMQEQANLTVLGQARLALFQVFCLPTMQHQTSQQFLWIIRTDPNLDTKLLKKLVRLVQPFSNFYIVGSNHNFRINQDFPGAWRNGAQGRDLAGLYKNNHDKNNATDAAASLFPTRVYTGNRTLLEMAMALEAQLPILETRLDADDGLHVQFIETVQKEAREHVFSKSQQQPKTTSLSAPQEPRLKWKYWCAQRNVEWHWSLPSLSNKNKKHHQRHDDNDASLLYGKLAGVQHQDMCITAGITAAFPIGTTDRQVPVFPHTELAWRIQHQQADAKLQQQELLSCGLSNASNCLEFLKVHPFEAVRSRTPTSHGMLDILLGSGVSATTKNDDRQQRKVEEDEDQQEEEEEVEDAWLNYAYWDILNRGFRIQREQIRFVQEYLMDNLAEIAKENLLGQCTTGHSCKPEAKQALETIIATYSNEKLQ
jgi:hypothetical protein